MSDASARARAAGGADHPQHCITCGDDGVAMTVVGRAADGLATCAAEDGATSAVDVTLVVPLTPGARVLVHAGVAIALLDGTPA
jgi:hypothetical protein